jgi:hypothetical protein
MQKFDDDYKGDRRDPIVSQSASPAERSKKRRAGYLIVFGIVIVALPVLAEWLLNGTIMLSKAQ